MKDLWMITRFLLKQNLSLSYVKNKMKTDKRYRNMMIIVVVALLICIPSFAIFMGLFVKLYDVFAQMNQESFYIVLAVFFSAFIIIFFGMFQIISYFYFSNDVKALMPLPLKTSYVLLSKFFVVYIWQLVISVFAVLPFFIIYAVKAGIPAFNWITMFLSFILLPIIPIVVIGFITILIMTLTKMFRSKDAIRMAGYILLLIGVIGLQVLFNRSLMSAPPGEEMEYYQNIFSNNSYLFEKAAAFYPVITLIGNAMTGNIGLALLSVIILALVSFAFIYLFGLFLQGFFLKSYLSEQTATIKRKKINTNGKSSGVAYAIAKIDFFTLLKTPMYALNTLALVILVPVLMVIMVSTGMSAQGSAQFSQLFGFYDDYKAIIWLGAAVFLSVFSSLTPVTSTSFSREGKTSWIMRTLPISAKDHIMGRCITAFIMTTILELVTYAILIFGITQYVKIDMIDIIYIVVSFILGLIMSVPLTFVGLFIDLKRPLLKWDNPQVPVKQNMNVLISMAFGMAFAIIMVLIYLLIITVLHFPVFVLYIVYFALSVFLAYLIYSILVQQFEKSLKLMIE